MKNSFIFNILALINVISGFLFTLSVMYFFGITEETDRYFVSILVLANLNVLIGVFYAGFFQYYLKEKESDVSKAFNLYFVVILTSIIVSIFILVIYQCLYLFIDNDMMFFNDFIQKYSYLLLFIAVFEINNFLINGNRFYAFPYFLLIGINIINFLAVLFLHNYNIDILIYSNLVAYLSAITIQIIFIYRKIYIKFSFKYNKQLIISLVKDSFIIKTSSVVNGSTDLVIAYLFGLSQDGLYSLYSYARKFALAIFNISNGPLIKKFNTEIASLILMKNYHEIITKLLKLLKHTLPIFFLGTLITYLSLPIVLELMGKNFLIKDIEIVKNIFIFLSIFYSLLTIEYLYITIINQFHRFKYGLYINIIYALLFLLLSNLSYYYSANYYYILGVLVLVLLLNILMEYYVVTQKLFKGKK